MRTIDIEPIIRNLTAMKSMYDAIAIDAMIKALEEAPAVDAVEVVHGRWIPVTERLPGNYDFVLVIVSGKAGYITLDNAIELAQFDMDDGWILELWPEWEDPKVTYWMPLPDPPKEDLKRR